MLMKCACWACRYSNWIFGGLIAFILVVLVAGCAAPPASHCVGKPLHWKVFVGCPTTQAEDMEWQRRIERNARQDYEWQAKKTMWDIRREARR